jgi:SAM-dependent methyltransferase
MDVELRRAWTEVVTADDYDAHMTAIGQAQAAAELTAELLRVSGLAPGCRVLIAGAGTGQLLDLVAPDLLRPYSLTFSDLNGKFLVRLRERLAQHGLRADTRVDDIEHSRLSPRPDLLLASLLLEHVGWKACVRALALLEPISCGVIIQENPPSMTSAVTPGRPLPPTIEEAVRTAHPELVPRTPLIASWTKERYHLVHSAVRNVADGKRLVGLLFRRSADPESPRSAPSG